MKLEKPEQQLSASEEKLEESKQEFEEVSLSARSLLRFLVRCMQRVEGARCMEA